MVRILSAPAAAAILLAGGWYAGAEITNDFTASMLLTGGWVALVGLGCVALVARRREMWPALAAYAVTATVAGLYLASETLIDDRVDEQVVTAAPARAGDRGSGPTANAGGARPTGNTLVAEGRFESLEHETGGVAQVIEMPDGRRFLTLTRFETDNGPDLRVYLSTPDADQGSSGSASEDLGALKGNVGDQQYEVPPSVNVTELSRALIWCRAFSAGFGFAQLQGR